MARFDEHDLPEELRAVEARLRAARPDFAALELDNLKLRAMASSGDSSAGQRTRGRLLRSRTLALALTTLLVGGTTAGAIAGGGAGGSSGNAAEVEYKHGCDDSSKRKCCRAEHSERKGREDKRDDNGERCDIDHKPKPKHHELEDFRQR